MEIVPVWLTVPVRLAERVNLLVRVFELVGVLLAEIVPLSLALRVEVSVLVKLWLSVSEAIGDLVAEALGVAVGVGVIIVIHIYSDGTGVLTRLTSIFIVALKFGIPEKFKCRISKTCRASGAA